MKTRTVCILGGTGFVGKHLAAHLHNQGIRSRILTRRPERHRELKVLPGLQLSEADIFDLPSLSRNLEGCDALVNLVGILNETGRNATFKHVHVELAEKAVEACREAGVGRLLQMSALHADADAGPSVYLKTKGEAEAVVHGAEPAISATSFRPSVIFGPGDSFFNRFAALLRLSPGFFPLACPDAKFAPVFVGDVCAAFATALDRRETFGRRYDLCGPQVFTLRELVEYTARRIRLRTRVIGLSDGLSKRQAQIFQHLPGKPFTLDNYLSLQVDSVCPHNGLPDLGITPTHLDAIVPGYL